MFKDLVYCLFIILIFISGYVGYLALQKQAYIIYAPLFVDAYTRANKASKDLQVYPSMKNLHDEIFAKKQKELSLKIVNSLIAINKKFNYGGEIKRVLEKYKASPNPDQDFFLVREFQESMKLLPPIKWNVPKQFYYFAATSLCLGYDELITLDGLRWTFIQKAAPLEAILQSQREQDASNYCIQKNAVLAHKKIFDDWTSKCALNPDKSSPACADGLNNLSQQWAELQKINTTSEEKLKARWQDWRLPACAN
jgi:hypothetical protein